MHLFIVYAHPSRESFTFQILEQLKKGLLAANHTFEVSDLYEMDFNSDMSQKEYEREGKANLELPISKDVLSEHAKIERADAIIFLYPLWWSDCPAKMKGWFDRVYSIGYAYGYDAEGNKTQQMKEIEKGIVICTAGHPNDYLQEIGIADSIRNVMIDDRLGKRFKEKEMIILGGTINIKEVKQQHLDRAFNLGKEL